MWCPCCWTEGLTWRQRLRCVVLQGQNYVMITRHCENVCVQRVCVYVCVQRVCACVQRVCVYVCVCRGCVRVCRGCVRVFGGCVCVEGVCVCVEGVCVHMCACRGCVCVFVEGQYVCLFEDRSLIQPYPTPLFYSSYLHTKEQYMTNSTFYTTTTILLFYS